MRLLLKLSGLFAVLAGTILILGGLWGISFTYKNIVRENIVTPEDASIPNAAVKGPFTLKAQADIIRKHALEITEGKTYSEMPRQIESVDKDGNPVLDDEGKPVMAPNKARDTWITVTALTTALNLGILTYAFSGFTLLMGMISVWTGIVFFTLNTNLKKR
jgi:hypothetical protein